MDVSAEHSELMSGKSVIFLLKRKLKKDDL